MSMPYRVPTLLILIFCAFCFGVLGSMTGMSVFLLFAVLFESAFWFGLFKRMRRPRQKRE